MSSEVGATDGPGEPEPCLAVAAVARRLGIAPATLRTWDRRYGLGPTRHSAGQRRRYTPGDIGRLELMRRLVLDGVPPAEAARVAVSRMPAPPPAAVAAAVPVPPDRVAARLVRPGRPGRPGGPGGRILAIPGASPEVRGLARAAMALDAAATRAAVEAAVRRYGVVAAWDALVRPVLTAVGARWQLTGTGVEVEHLLTETTTGVLRALARAPEPGNGRPVLLACAPGDLHCLPLAALAAGLAEDRIGVRLLGAGLPVEALAAAVRRTGAAAVLVFAQLARTADTLVLEALPALRPRVTVLAGGAGWVGPLPRRVTHVPDLATAVGEIRRVVAG